MFESSKFVAAIAQELGILRILCLEDGPLDMGPTRLARSISLMKSKFKTWCDSQHEERITSDFCLKKSWGYHLFNIRGIDHLMKTKSLSEEETCYVIWTYNSAFL
ncbi:hypothetical protein CEXT_533221 [Caerostris extrusa]|uniref:Uncharacterized protein n=1 Tax=Caerostris extrusa TaxID=172846 RepID=A0AAV4MSW2_CAEEX|nr:hypothetical protein CEXT_533221 [Caerostris extrusa]